MSSDKLDIALTKTRNALLKTINSINFVDGNTDALVENITLVNTALTSIESILAGESQSTPFIYTSSILPTLSGTEPASGKVVDAVHIWNIEKRLDDLIGALALFDGDANPTDYLENLNQIMTWVQSNTDFLSAMSTATITTSGFMSPAMVTKLNGVEAGATKNVISNDVNDTSTATVPSSKVTSDLLAMLDDINLTEMTADELADPATATGYKKFTVEDVLDLVRVHGNSLLQFSRFTRTIYIPGYLTVQEFPIKLIVPEGTWLGAIDTAVSNNNNDAEIRLTHTDGTIINVIRAPGSTSTVIPTMKSGSWTISVINSGTVTAIDMTLYVDLIKEVV